MEAHRGAAERLTGWGRRLAASLWIRLLRLRHRLACRGGRRRLRQTRFREPFLRGVNLPWLSYGNDFGANAWHPGGGIAAGEGPERLERIFAGLARGGADCLRWFLFCDGRAGIREDAQGRPSGLDEALFSDLDRALEIAARHRLRLIFVLFDFHLCAPGQTKRGVQLGGRRSWIAKRIPNRALRKRVLKPLLLRYGRRPEVLAWDLFNEPEWATFGLGGREAVAALPPWRMRRFLAATVRLARRHARQPVTVGLASARGLPLVLGLGLDLFQVHWYDRFDDDSPLDAPVERLGLNRPLLLGEFPTRNSARARSDIEETARRNGYCGALAWSLLATDSVSGMPAPEWNGAAPPAGLAAASHEATEGTGPKTV